MDFPCRRTENLVEEPADRSGPSGTAHRVAPPLRPGVRCLQILARPPPERGTQRKFRCAGPSGAKSRFPIASAMRYGGMGKSIRKKSAVPSLLLCRALMRTRKIVGRLNTCVVGDAHAGRILQRNPTARVNRLILAEEKRISLAGGLLRTEPLEAAGRGSRGILNIHRSRRWAADRWSAAIRESDHARPA